MKIFPSSFKIDRINIGANNRCAVIAEAGVSHFGSLKKGLDLVDLAVNSNSDIFKLQHYVTENLISDKNSEWFKRLKEKELTNNEVIKIKERCDEKNITFLCTAHDKQTLDFLDKELDVPAFKIGSGEVQNWPFIQEISSRGKPIVLSTGMYDIEMIKKVIEIIRLGNCPALSIMHCVTAYPANPIDINLNVMNTIRDFFEGPVGYSDHTEGTLIPLASIPLGADIIEKHITIDRDIPNAQDWKVSCDPSNLRSFIRDIRDIESALGDGVIKINNSQQESIKWARKSIISKRNIKKGEFITEECLILQRPGIGIPGSQIRKVLGKKAVNSIPEGKIIM